jgi:hypothetical protein
VVNLVVCRALAERYADLQTRALAAAQKANDMQLPLWRRHWSTWAAYFGKMADWYKLDGPAHGWPKPDRPGERPEQTQTKLWGGVSGAGSTEPE